MWRSLWFYRHLNGAALLGVAVAAAVLTGALLVGDSVRESLRRITLDRLGEIRHAVAAEHMMRAELADRLSATPGGFAVGALALRGGVSGDKGYAARVGVYGVTANFARLFPEGGLSEQDLAAALTRESGQVFPPAVVNQALARELDAAVGDELVLAFEGVSEIHRDSLYGEKDTEDVVKKLRVSIARVIDDRGMGRFGLTASQQAPLNLFAPLPVLQRALDQSGKINAVMIAAEGDGEPALTDVRRQLRQSAEPEDLNLAIRAGDGVVALETPGFFLKPAVVEAARAAAAALDVPSLSVSTYLANRIEANGRMVPYSLMAAVEGPASLAPLRALSGKPRPGDGEIVLNRWAAEDLGAQLGDVVDLTYFGVGANDELVERPQSLTLAGIVAMEGFALDRDLTPDFSGISETDDMSDWDPPFEMDMGLIRNEDEIYWDQYGAAPKAFVSEASGRAMWESRFGYLTGLRLAPAAGATPEETRDRFRQALAQRLDPEKAGVSLLAARERGLAASTGATDFTSLFIAMSFFIILAAALLVGLFFRLMVDQRRSEAGLMLAMGYRAGAVRRRFLGEGLAIAAAGAALGALGGVLYARGVMWALRAWWSLGTSQLHYYGAPASLALGAVIAVFVALISIWLTARRIGRVSATRLIAGGELPDAARAGRRSAFVFWGALAAAVACLAGALAGGLSVALFFGAGASLLVAGLSLMARGFARPRSAVIDGAAWPMAYRNASRRAGRSLVSASLVAFACFVIVAVGLSRNTGGVDVDDRRSGAGGFFLEAETDIPLHWALDREKGWAELGLDDALAERLRAAEILSFRLRPGDDASCLNLYAPQQPRVLGAPDAGAMAGRFAFQAHAGGDVANPWSLLEQDLDDGAIPAIVDANSAMWILHSGLGQDFPIQNERGETVRLRFVGLLQKGVFQSELIIAERHFQRHFPSSSGFSYFLLDDRSADRGELGGALEAALSDYGLDATSTAEKIKRFHEIENTYISIFQTLGGLGLLLGTLGLGAIIFRNALERRGEMAAMRAFGFRRRRLARLLLAENALLIFLGVAIGSVSATVAMTPRILAENADPSIPALLLTLALVSATGLLASIWAVSRASRFPLLASLRHR